MDIPTPVILTKVRIQSPDHRPQRPRETQAAGKAVGRTGLHPSAGRAGLGPAAAQPGQNRQYICCPPLMLSVDPVTNPPSSEHRNATPRAISVA